jgi:XTP/dITP diphosphohydrolase
MKLYLASNNAHKAAEFAAMAPAARGPAHLPGAPTIELHSATEIGGMPAVVEDAGSFVGNARLKAQALRSKAPSDGWVLADDSGLCVAALDGAPGVESAYFAGPQGDPQANLDKLVALTRAVPDGLRQAKFICILLLLGPDGSEHIFEGVCDGTLLHAPRGGGGFGYDPLFVPFGREASFAELPDAVKSQIGHRGRAWSALVSWARDRASRAKGHERSG